MNFHLWWVCKENPSQCYFFHKMSVALSRLSRVLQCPICWSQFQRWQILVGAFKLNQGSNSHERISSFHSINNWCNWFSVVEVHTNKQLVVFNFIPDSISTLPLKNSLIYNRLNRPFSCKFPNIF